MQAIQTVDLAKTYRVRAADGAGRGLARFWPFRRGADQVVAAVRGITLSIARGERVAFIGPNGAGKSTMLKMLTGILEPTSGHAEVAGLVPWRQRRQVARRIGILFGQRSQLLHHLPVRDSFELLARIHGMDRATEAGRVANLSEAFGIADLLARPVAELSLGQRLRVEIAAALLHAPDILFLDEPTIGLDVTAKAALRDHLNALSRASGTTILLTSHDTGDIDTIAERVIVIDHGSLLLDRSLERIKQEYMGHRTLTLVTDEERPELDLPGVVATGREPHRLTLKVDRAVAAIERVVASALDRFAVRDLAIENPPLDEIIAAIYRNAPPGPIAAPVAATLAGSRAP